jgi:DNA-binding response OmpR family regulator
MVLDLESRQLRRGDHVVRMTKLEFRLLQALMHNVGRVVTSGRLIEQTWGVDGGDANMLKTHICHIRKKLGLRDGEPGYIRSIIDLGYTMCA